MATGLHRNEVGKIRAGGVAMARETMQIKERLYSKSARVLNGWSTDPRLTASGGSPLDLPIERNKQRRSFEDLVDKYAPGNHPGTVLKELKRRGNVELLDGDVVRFKSANTQARGVTPATVSKAALSRQDAFSEDPGSRNDATLRRDGKNYPSRATDGHHSSRHRRARKEFC